MFILRAKTPIVLGPYSIVNMQTKWLVIRTIFRVTLYFILLVFFVYFYMKDQMSDYIINRSTVASRIEEANGLQFPTITLCMHPAQKPSVAKEFDYMWFWAVFRKNINSTLTLPQRYAKLHYLLNRDYELKFYINTGWVQIKDGKNQVEEYGFGVDNIATWREGFCTKIVPKFQVTRIPFHFYMNVSLNQNLTGNEVKKNVS